MTRDEFIDYLLEKGECNRFDEHQIDAIEQFCFKLYDNTELDKPAERIAELEDKLQMASLLCKPKSLEAHNLEQQAKGLEDYVIKTMDNNYILHLDPECNHQAFLINLNATALRLREHAKGGAE